MTMTDEECRDIIQAKIDGKTIEAMGANSQWVETNCFWNFIAYKYRIKPEPFTCWNIYSNDKTNAFVASFETEKSAHEYSGGRGTLRVIKMQEVG